MRCAVPLVWLIACYSPHLPSPDGGDDGTDAVPGDAAAADAEGGDATLFCALGAEGDLCRSASGLAGRCRNGLCCTGCWDGSSCRFGTTISDCGREGQVCARCDAMCVCDTGLCPGEGDSYLGPLCSGGSCTLAEPQCCGPVGDAVCSATSADVCNSAVGCL